MCMRNINKKLFTLCFFMNPILMGMDAGEPAQVSKKYFTQNRRYYAEIGDPGSLKKMYSRVAYPVFVKRNETDPKQYAWFNFDHPVKSVEWDMAKEYALYVTLHGGKKHVFPLDYLQ